LSNMSGQAHAELGGATERHEASFFRHTFLCAMNNITLLCSLRETSYL
jgi:hypothetical protein